MGRRPVGYREAVSDPPAVADIDLLEAARLLAAGAMLLDVREDDEWEVGHAPGATHVPMGQVGVRLDELRSGEPVVCVCRVGARSAAVAAELAAAGFDVRNLAGGMVAWEQAGRPIVTGSGRPGRVS